MANGKDFAGNLKFTMPDQTRGAQAAVQLRCFKESVVQIGVILLKRGDLQLRLLEASIPATSSAARPA